MTDLLKDGKGKFSQSRTTAFIWGAGVFVVWAYMCIVTGTVVTLPKEIVYLTLGVQGWKVVQGWKELSTNSPLEDKSNDKIIKNPVQP
jgi:hypothetical protein